MREGIEAALTQLHAALDVLSTDALDGLSDEDVLDLTGRVEVVARRVVPVQERLAAEADRRGVACAYGCAKTSVLLAQLLRLSRSEANARLRAAGRFVERRGLTGEVLAPLLPAVAAAQRAGDISPRHAAVIGDAIDALPDAVDEAGQVAEIEGFLVEQARQFTPETLATVTRRLVDTLDPDGTLRDVDYRDRRRGLTVRQRPDGSVTGRFEGTAEFGELLLTVLDVAAAPKPAVDGVRDERSVEQRQHDGLTDALRLVLRANELPSVNGVAATVILTATTEQWQDGTGLVRSGHGALIPTVEARRIAGGEARHLPVILDDTADPPPAEPPEHQPDQPPLGRIELRKIFRSVRPVTGYGDCARLFTQNQKLVLIARDGGCSFPGCTVPAIWCEADHIQAWADGGPTSIDNGHLLCPHHHREKDRQGWRVTMINQLPHWTPPAWLDPDQTPRHNHAHHPLSLR